MGISVCCAESRGFKTSNLHIYQINRYYSETESSPKIDLPEKISFPPSLNQSNVVEGALVKDSTISERLNSETLIIEENTNDIKNSINSSEKEKKVKRKQNLKNINGEFQLYSYDIDEERFSKFKIIFPIIKSIEGLSELLIKSNLFLCGISPKQKNEGSFLFKISLDSIFGDEDINAQILINSHYPHVYPSLISDKNGQIICVGGKGQTQCELFNNNLNKWFMLPNIPEERYKCNLCLDPKEIYVYLFGGINRKQLKNKNENNLEDNEYMILRMDLIKQLTWEKIIIKNESKNLIINRFSSGCFTFKNDEDFIFLIGGEDAEKNYLDNIIRYSISKETFESTGIKLQNKAKFTIQYGILKDYQTYCFIDSLNKIHNIDRHDCLPMDYHPSQI